MKTARILMSLTLAGLLGAAVGCEKKVMMHVHNFTSGSQDLTLVENGFPTEIGTVAPDTTNFIYKIVIRNDDLPANFTLKAGEFTSQPFQITDKTRDDIYFSISPQSGLQGPFDSETKVNIQEKAKVRVKVGTQEKVE